ARRADRHLLHGERGLADAAARDFRPRQEGPRPYPQRDLDRVHPVHGFSRRDDRAAQAQQRTGHRRRKGDAMKRRPFFAIPIALAIAAGLFAASSAHAADDQAAKDKPGKELNLFAWSEYVPQAVIDGFTKETGIQVNYETYASNEEMLAK